MACLIKNWKYFYPLKLTHLPFLDDIVKSILPLVMSKYNLIGPSVEIKIHHTTYEECSKP